MRHTILSHLQLTLLEAARTRLAASVACTAIAGLGVALLVGEVAITDTRRMQAAIAAALLRLAAVAIIGVFVIASQLRAVEDKTIDVLLTLPWSRATYYLGRLAGFACVAAAVAAALSAVLMPFSGAAVLPWGVSLALELMLVAAAALFFAGATRSVSAAFTALAGLYLLGRAITALQLIGGSEVLGTDAPAQIARSVLGAIGWILPRLDLFTRSEWLAGAAPAWALLGPICAQAATYVLLLAIAGIIDLQRREF